MDTIKITDDEAALDTMKFTDDEAVLSLGKNGKAEEKISRVSEADIGLFESGLILEIRGSKLQRRRAKEHAECVLAQHTGPTSIAAGYDNDDPRL